MSEQQLCPKAISRTWNLSSAPLRSHASFLTTWPFHLFQVLTNLIVGWELQLLPLTVLQIYRKLDVFFSQVWIKWSLGNMYKHILKGTPIISLFSRYVMSCPTVICLAFVWSELSQEYQNIHKHAQITHSHTNLLLVRQQSFLLPSQPLLCFVLNMENLLLTCTEVWLIYSNTYSLRHRKRQKRAR